MIHGQIFTHPNVVVHEAMEFRRANEEEGRDLAASIIPNQKWKPPLLGIFKVNWDVAINQGQSAWE